ncbi:MAG: toprim domain-containing protein, partial [Humibacillus sp.]|nr:toprim domain-containing protein [Humibacillus sp.]
MDAVTARVASVKQLPDGVMVNCINPAHPDRHPSLHISHVDTEHGGRTLFHCHSCGNTATQQDFAAWAGLEYDDLFDDRRWGFHHRDAGPEKSVRQRRTGPTYGRLGPLPKPIATTLYELLGLPKPEADPAKEEHLPKPEADPAKEEHLPKPEADPAKEEHTYAAVETYLYLDEWAKPFHRVHRQRCTDDGCTVKNFPQEYLRAGSDPAIERNWATSKEKAGLPYTWATRLYRHAQVELAVADGMPVWIFEGEKDVHTAEGEALVATTNPGGGKNFAAHLAEPFRGAGEVCAVHDRDEVGYARAVRLEELLNNVGAQRVRHFLPATTAAKSDFTDHIEAGYPVEDLVELPVAAFAAWHTLSSTAAAAVATVFTCESEVDARLRLAEHETAQGRRTAGADNRRYASRWVKEAARAHAKLVDAVRAITSSSAGIPVDDNPVHAAGLAWAREAVEVAGTQLRTVTGVVQALFEKVGEITPPEVT